MKRLFLVLLAAALCATSAFANLTFTATTTGSTAAQAIYEGRVKNLVLVEVRATGTFGGTTITVQTRGPDGATWIDTGVSLTAAGVDYFYVMPGDEVRITCTGGTGINVSVRIR